MGKYKVLDCLNHGQQQYQSGDEVELTDEEAAPLLLLGVVEIIETKVTKK